MFCASRDQEILHGDCKAVPQVSTTFMNSKQAQDLSAALPGGE